MNSSATTVLCGYCGRPAPTAAWWGNVPYHDECTRSPSYVPHHADAHLLKLICELAQRVSTLEETKL